MSDQQPSGNDIKIFLHCNKCVSSLPPDTSPREYARLGVGLTDDGEVQVWCQRHEINVVRFQDPIELAAKMGMRCAMPDHAKN